MVSLTYVTTSLSRARMGERSNCFIKTQQIVGKKSDETSLEKTITLSSEFTVQNTNSIKRVLFSTSRIPSKTY